MIERDIPELAKLLRGFDESAYMLELNGEVMSRSSWDVAGFDGFDLRMALRHVARESAAR